MRCVWAFALLGVVIAQNYEALLPPTLRIENEDTLQPLYARKHPIEGPERIIESPQPSPSNIPRPLPVDTTRTSIGNCIEHRQYLDYPESLQLVFPGLTFAGEGAIDTWNVYTGRNCDLHAQVFRPAPVPKALDQNQYPVSTFTLVGENVLKVPEMGNHTFEIAEGERIHVESGDVVGIYTADPGCVAWSTGGPTTLYRYGIPGHNEMNAFKGVVFVGDGTHRTYSLSCEGDFSFTASELDMRTSPTPSHSLSTSHSPSGSPTISPSHSTSVSSIPSPTTSLSPSPSPSQPASISHTPSVSPTLFSKNSDCAQGPEFWCKTVQNMHMCNVTAHICKIIGYVLDPPLPSHLPGQPSATPSPSFSPSFNGPAASIIPSLSPSTSLVPPPYLNSPLPVDPNQPEGLSQCLYCNGGSDWKSETCSSGSQQSPISIKFEGMEVPAELDLYFTTNYNITHANVHWDNAAFSISSPTFGSMNVDAVNYKAELVKVRSPSEHKLEGMRTPLELQIFHRIPGTNPPQVLAVAVLFEETMAEVESLNWIMDIPDDKSDFRATIDLEHYISDLKSLAFYQGSMTQPPCQEGITWAVSMGTGKINYRQLKRLTSFLKENRAFALGRGNNRATQPLNSRKVTLRSNCGISGAITCGRDIPNMPVSAEYLPAEMGGTQEAKAQAVIDAPTQLNAASRREEEAAAQVLKDAEELLRTSGDDSMFDDGDVKLW